MENFFKLKENGTTVSKEVIGGITTFLTMAYIIFVHPGMLSLVGMDKGALITVTCLAAAFGTLLVGLWANVPFAMAPGMGLNAFFTFTLVMGGKATWQEALGVVLLSGLVFLVLTFIGVREKIVNAIPESLRLAVAAGIGLFITFIGLKNMGLVVADKATFVTMGALTKPVLIGLVGLITITVLEVKKIRGSILIGILITTILGIAFGEVSLPGKVVALPPSIAPIFWKFDLMGALKLSMIAPIFSFMFVDLFDSVGTIMACSYEAEMVDDDGSIKNIDKMLEADGIATVVGAVLGTSTTTTYIESASGIAAGARTGLASVVTASLFLIALLFSPIIGIVPAFATAPALIMVGVHMFKNIRRIDFSDFEIAVPAFLTIILMPLTYSISNGLSFGFLSFIVINLASGDYKKISPVMWIIGILSVLNLIFA